MLKFNLTESGLFAVFPWLTMAFSANLGGWIADTLVSRGVSVTLVRKVHALRLLSTVIRMCVSIVILQILNLMCSDILYT